MEQNKGLTGSTLKIIAMASMLIDHVAAILMTRMYITGGLSYELYNVILILRLVGRIAFPIYCFLLVEGFTRTKDVRKYLLRMLAFALITEIPFDLALTGKVMNFHYQNVMFTMAIGLVALYGLKTIEEKAFSKGMQLLLQIVVVSLAAVIATLCKTDYSWSGIVCICAIYLLKKSNVRKMLLGNAALILASTLEVTALISVPLVGAYNGKRGMKLKYFFYAFYPVHLLLLHIICVLMGMGDISTLQY